MQLIRVLIAASFFATPVRAEDVQVIDIQPGEQSDIFFQVNTTGQVYLKIVSENGDPCADFWWIKWPFGTVEQLGRKCGNVVFDIPGVSSASVSSKLRAGGIGTHIKIGVFSNESVFSKPISFSVP
jgi:hypothetical protein